MSLNTSSISAGSEDRNRTISEAELWRTMRVDDKENCEVEDETAPSNGHLECKSNDAAKETEKDQEKWNAEEQLSADDELCVLEDEAPPEYRVQPPPHVALPQISPYIIIPTWIILSGGLIIFNKWIFSTKGFCFPVFLTAFHMVVAIIGTNILRYTTHLLVAAEKPLPRRIRMHAIFPIALLYSFSLVLSNAACLHLSVSLVQMIKASIPVILHLISCAVGLARMDKITAMILFMVSSGCVIASTGELQYNVFGLACQIGAVIAEASRLVVVQVLLRDIKMNPLVSIYYYAPVCLVFIGISLPFLEGAEPFYNISDLGWHILLTNGLMAFALNVSSVLLISSSGSLVSSLSGVLKDIILIPLSVLLFGSVVSAQQVFGYGISLVGLISFRDKDRIVSWLQKAKSRSGGGPHFFSPKGIAKLLALMSSGLLIVFAAFQGVNRPSPSELGVDSYFNKSAYLDDAGFKRSLGYTSPFNINTPPLELSDDPNHSQFPIRGSAEEIIPDYSPYPDASILTPFAWVIVLNVDQLRRYAELVSHLNCYALRLGIPIYVDWVLHDNERHFFTARHYNLVKYLKRHQWVMFTDGDILIADSTKDPRDIIAQATDDVDVIFSDRDSGEICACGYLIKNSPGGWSFLRRWISWSGEPNGHNTNWDNGDLNELIFSGIRPGFPANQDGSSRLTRAEIDALIPTLTEEQKDCSNLDIKDHYYWVFRRCFIKAMSEYRLTEPWKPWWTIRIFEWSNVLPPTTVRVYREFGGFIRNHPNHFSGHYTKRIDTDFLYHLHKESKLFNSSMTLCTGEEWQFEPAGTDKEFRDFVHDYHSQSYHKCWDESGGYHCGADGPKEGWGWW